MRLQAACRIGKLGERNECGSVKTSDQEDGDGGLSTEHCTCVLGCLHCTRCHLGRRKRATSAQSACMAPRKHVQPSSNLKHCCKTIANLCWCAAAHHKFWRAWACAVQVTKLNEDVDSLQLGNNQVSVEKLNAVTQRFEKVVAAWGKRRSIFNQAWCAQPLHNHFLPPCLATQGTPVPTNFLITGFCPHRMRSWLADTGKHLSHVLRAPRTPLARAFHSSIALTLTTAI